MCCTKCNHVMCVYVKLRETKSTRYNVYISARTINRLIDRCATIVGLSITQGIIDNER